MVSRSVRIFRLIEKEMPGFVLCNDMLVIPPTEHIVRGFLIENTSEKGRIYLWKVVNPLHRPMQSVTLNYSDRIFKNGVDVYIDPKAYKESAALIGSIISEHVDDLSGIRTPKDFLRHIRWVTGGGDFNCGLDLALTHCRLGHFRKGREILKDLSARYDVWRRQMDEMMRQTRVAKIPDPLDDLIKLVTRLAEGDPGALIALMDQWERENMELLGLGPSRPIPKSRRASD